MLATLSILLTFATLFSPASATCHPNFSGRAVSIVSNTGNVEWGTGTLVNERPLAYQSPSSDEGEFKIEFTPVPDSTYYIKSAYAPANNFYAAQGPRSTIVSWLQIDTGFAPRWEINCDYCSPTDAWSTHGTFASDCKITLYGLCVKEDADSIPGSNINLHYSCDGSSSELVDFVLP